MSDDSLATPINKLPAVSTRDAPKPSGGDVSYADILKQQEMERHQFDQQQQASAAETIPMQPQFQDPQQGMPQQPMYQDYYQQDPGFQPGYQQQPPPPPPPPPQLPGESGEAAPVKKKWWRVWLLENKTGWIVALVTFLLLTFVYPRIRGMARFAGMPLPYWATGGMSVLGAAMVTAIDVSL